tara:strand:+ start:52 stop:1893 length:1842 start_codon:yes stop_codon:yes gene_type:complete
VPNYEVNLELALKGATEAAQKIKNLRKNTKELDKDINRFNRSVNKSMGRKKGEGSFVYSFQTLSKEVNSARAALNKAAIGTEEFNKAIKNVVEVEETYNDELKKRDRALRIQRIAQQKGISLTKAEVELERQLAKAKEATAKKERGKRFGQTISSAAIGGAFPLLFGQTGAAAIGGGTGGLIGGAIGGQFGFALSIVGTALGAAVEKNQKFNESLAVLNARLSTVGDGSRLVAKDIDDLARRFRVTKEEAFGLLEGFKEFDNPRLRKSLVEVFGSDSGAFQGLGGSNRQAKLAQQIFEARKQIGDQQATQLLQQNLINGAETIELALIRAKIKARQRDQIEQAKQISLFGRIGAGFRLKTADEVIENRIKKLEKTFAETEDQTIKDTIEGLKILREQLNLVNEAQGQFGQSGVLAFSAINDKVKDLQDEMKALQNPIRAVIEVSDVMATSFEESFKGIIKGTMTVADAFRNMLNKIADYFIDTAARMMANQLQQGILGLFSNLFSPAPLGDVQGEFMPSRPQFRGAKAEGGPVKGGSSYLVGERGPELFSPGVSGMITPNHALGGSTNVVVNVDASGSSVEGDEEQGRELGRLISVAVQSEILQQKRPGGLLA